MYIYILYIYIYIHICIYINNNLTWLGHGMSWICGEIWKFLKDFTETTGLNGGDSHDRNNTGGDLAIRPGVSWGVNKTIGKP